MDGVRAAAGRNAHAANVEMSFCVTYNLDYNDDTMGDHLQNSTAPGGGILLRFIEQNGSYFGKYMDWEGANIGCRTVTLDDELTYTVKVIFQARVNGNTIYVKDDQGQVFETLIDTIHPVASGTRDYSVGPSPRVRVIAAAGFAMSRFVYGITDEDFSIRLEDCPTSGSSCDRRTADGNIYISTTEQHNRWKYITVHELGHALADEANGADDANDDDAPVGDCDDTYVADGHSMNSKEYQSNAAVEGIAHFYVAAVFNDDLGFGSDCEFELHYRPNWNVLDSDADGNDPLIFSCELGIEVPSSEAPNDADIDNFDYFGDWCAGSGGVNNRGTEYDWLRLFWDLHTDAGLTPGDIMDIWVAANPDTWLETGNGTGVDYPADRMSSGAFIVGGTSLQDDYDYWAALNGTDR